jgi:hypothetical protein
MKKTLLSASILFFSYAYQAQVLYNNSFGNLSLQTYTTANTSVNYTSVPIGFSVINDGLKNNVGSANNPNKPFNEPNLKTVGWAVVFNQLENDTFLVSTSWLDTNNVAVNRWLITPTVSNLNNNSVLTWLAKSPDANYADGYEVYGTGNLNASQSQDFLIGDRLFSIADGNSSGGGEKSTWTRRSVPLGQFAGQSLKFAFRNNSKDLYQLWIDDIQVVNAANSLDAGLNAEVPRKYLLTGTSDTVKLSVTNFGAAIINTINTSYQVGNSSVNTENISIPNGLGFGQTASFKFALPYSISAVGLYGVKSWINTVNGLQDQNAQNDIATYSCTVLNTSAPKTVMLEQFVSANNGEGPEAQEYTNSLQSSTLIVVNVHDQDSLKENNSVALINDYKKNIPTAMADRYYFDDIQSTTFEKPSYTARANTRAAAITPVSLSVLNKTYNPSTRALSFTLKADFLGEVKGDYRINAYLTENNVSGPVNDNSVNGYNQLNSFYNVPWSTYYQKGFYVAAVNNYLLNYWEFKHQNVLVHAFDGAYGNSGTIPSTGGTTNQSYQQTFTLTLPSPSNGVRKFNADNLYIVGFVGEYNNDKTQRQVLNAVKSKVTANNEVLGISEALLNSHLNIYPNPSSGIVFIDTTPFAANCEIDVFNLMGVCVWRTATRSQSSFTKFDLSVLPAGLYTVLIKDGEKQSSEKLVIER